MKLFDYNTEAWRRKRQKILRRDGYRCQICKRYGQLRLGLLFACRKKEVIRMAKYEQSTEMAELGWSVIREHPDLAWIAQVVVSGG